MDSVIVVHPDFEAHWPFSGDHMHDLWREQGPVEFIRLKPDDDRVLGDVVRELDSATIPTSRMGPSPASGFGSWAMK